MFYLTFIIYLLIERRKRDITEEYPYHRSLIISKRCKTTNYGHAGYNSNTVRNRIY